MAKNNNLTDFLTDVANAIREKDGSTGMINPQDFSDKIKAVQTGIDTSDGNIEPTTVLKGYKGYAKGVAVNGAIETYDGTVEDVVVVYTDCLTFTGETSDFTLKATYKEWDGTVEYSTDHSTWTIWNGTAVSSVDKKLYLRGSGNTKFRTRNGARLSLSSRAACSGNIQTLLEYSNPPTSITGTNCFMNLFLDCTNLTQAPDLPATTLSYGCYDGMFIRCANLTTVPPMLPATTLTPYCYSGMFSECIRLTKAPELAATILADNCCESMFYGCTSLKISETQSTEYPTSWRIPSFGTISSTASEWNIHMLFGTGGTFTDNPSINTTYYGAW